MNRLRRVVNNTVISLIGQAVTWTSTFILTLAYGRFLGDVKFGELYFAITFVTLIGFPLEFGFNQQLTRDVAQVPEKAMRYLSTTLLLKFMLWPVLYGTILAICYLLNYSPETRLLVAISGITLLSGSIANTFGALHNAFERVVYPVVGTVLEKGSSALLGWLLLRQGIGVVPMACVLLAGSSANALWQAINCFRLQGLHLTFDRRLLSELVRSSIPFLAYGVLGVIYYRLDTVLLSLETNDAVVGWYGAGYRLFDTLVFLPNIVILAIMYPLLSKFSVTSEEILKMAIEKSMNFLLFCGIPIATTMIVAAPQIIGFMYHNADFLPSIQVLQMLAPGLIFLYVNTVLSTTLMSIKQEKKVTIMAAIALLFNLGLNLWLIPLWQHIGAALVTSLTELLLLCLATAFIPRHLWPRKSLLVGTKIIVASLVMAGVMRLLYPFGLYVLLLAGGLVYLAVIALLRTIPRSDIQALYQAIRNRKQTADPELIDTLPLPALTTQPLPALNRSEVMNSDDETTQKIQSIFYSSQPASDESETPTQPLRNRHRLPHTPRPEFYPDQPVREEANARDAR
ncbi:MAG: polysaccharide biosynthesis C-terminal domain-containing protein [Ktedonobacteraceae bacterium]|nr:polysaccharide biosynthesis C-terminal domain-containing protein [Ktedonobacteraceae bacterium]MBO0790103.1 polysaccharide biosynthesis C-terminal domain-containing protein [Ktedonobacteraceae bacterium]